MFFLFYHLVHAWEKLTSESIKNSNVLGKMLRKNPRKYYQWTNEGIFALC